MRWERVSVPLPIARGVKTFDAGPLGASSLAEMPFPGRAASSAETLEGARRIEPIVTLLNESKNEGR